MKFFCKLVSLACISVAFPVDALVFDHKSAYPQKMGHFYISAAYSHYESHEFWNSQGKKREAYNNFEADNYFLYGEYGVTNADTIRLEAGWGRIEESINGRTFGFKDIELGWKHFFGCRYSHAIAGEILAILPTDREYQPGLRYGSYGAEIAAIATRNFSLYGVRCDYDLRLGYRYYDQLASDQIRCKAFFNIFPLSSLMITAGGSLEYGLFNGAQTDNDSFFLYNPNYRLFAGIIEATIEVYRGASLFLGYHQHLWGENVGTQGGFFGGIQIQF